MRHEMSQYILPTTSAQEQWNDMENFLKSLKKKFIPTKVFRPQKHNPGLQEKLLIIYIEETDILKHGKKTEDIHHSYLVQRALCQLKVRQAHKPFFIYFLFFNWNHFIVVVMKRTDNVQMMNNKELSYCTMHVCFL